MSLGLEDLIVDDEMTAVANTLDKESTQFIDALRKKNILFRDKLIYTFGVLNVIVTPYFLAAFPNYFYYWYTIKATSLIAFRWWTYKQNNWHYFLLDFCYFANLLILLYLYLFPSSPTLFCVVWSFSFGPLLWAIVLWKNCMVFHSVDKITSLFIHLNPALLMMDLRWKITDATKQTFAIPELEEISFLHFTIWPLCFYVCWQFLYWLKVYYVGGNRKDRVTSASWLLGAKKGFIYNLCKAPFGDKNADYGFMLVQLIFTILTIVPSYYFYHSELLTFVFTALMSIVSVWNGAQFYFEIFLDRYAADISKEVQRINEKNEKLKSAREEGFRASVRGVASHTS